MSVYLSVSLTILNVCGLFKLDRLELYLKPFYIHRASSVYNNNK